MDRTHPDPNPAEVPAYVQDPAGYRRALARMQRRKSRGKPGKPKPAKNSSPAAQYQALWQAAMQAGAQAAKACTPQAMVVQQRANPLDDNSPVVRQWHVPEGPCGFAGVVFSGRQGFGRWLRRTGRAGRHYPSGIYYHVAQYGQSLQRKEAHAQAMVDYLTGHGIKCYATSRLD